MNRLVIDTDPGVDDAHALMMAFAHPRAEVEAITTVAGNVSLAQTTANACIILDVLGQDTPLYAGCERALVADTPDASAFHGRDGLGESGYPPSPRLVARRTVSLMPGRVTRPVPPTTSPHPSPSPCRPSRRPRRARRPPPSLQQRRPPPRPP